MAAGDPPATPSSLSTGAETACLLKHDGSIACWGAVPGALPEGPFLDVSTGGDLDSESVCAVLATGALWCWGWIGNAVPSGTYRAVSVDGSYACAIAADDTLRCWGNDDAEAWPVPPTGTFRAVSVRPDYYSCAIRRDDGSIACWGAESGNVPNLPSGSFTSISRDCAIRDDDRLVCWGSGLPMSPTGTYADVSVGSDQELRRHDGRSRHVLGLDESGQSSPPEGSFRDIGVGEGFSCGSGPTSPSPVGACGR